MDFRLIFGAWRQRLAAGRGALLGVAGVGMFAASPLSAADSVENPPPDDRHVLAPLVVTSETDAVSYATRNSAIGTRTDTPLRDVPQAIQVVPRAVIRDQAALDVNQVVENVSGASRSQFGLFLRGFPAASYQNGIRTGIRQDVNFDEMTNVDRVEVLKGPSSVLFGRVDPGGIVNKVTKRPTAEPHRDVTARVGNNDRYRLETDLGGPLADGERLSYRLTGSYSNEGSFRDHVDQERFFLSPVIGWQPDSRTRVRLEAEFLYNEGVFDQGIVAVGQRPASVSRSRYLGEPDDRQRNRRGTVSVHLDREMSASWDWSSVLQWTRYDSRSRYHVTQGVRDDGRTVDRGIIDFERDDDSVFFQNDLVGHFRTGAVAHQLVLGAEVGYGRHKALSRRYADVAPIDLFNPQYGSGGGVLTGEPRSVEDRRLAGLYVQNQMDIGQRWIVLTGARFDHFRQRNRSRDTGVRDAQSDSEISPRAGVVYRLAPEVSLYGNVSRSFEPVFGDAVDGSSFDPERSLQYELGVKTDWLDGRMVTNLALFEITRENVLTPDPDNPGFSVQAGEQRSRGVEVDVAGEILPGWRVTASAAYLEAEVTRDNRFERGNRLAGIPRSTFSLFSTYQLQTGRFRGLGVGGGVFTAGSRRGDLDNSFSVPGYARVDAVAFQTFGSGPRAVRAQLNVRNVFDNNYFETASARTRINPGEPRSVLLSLSTGF